MGTTSFKRRWIRRALFQIHLWTGMVLGLYIVLISLTGSVLVFRREVYNYFRPGATVVPRGDRLGQPAIAEAAKRTYPRAKITRVLVRRRQPTASAEVWLDDQGTPRHRFFDPYTGQDVGDAEPKRATEIFERIADLHDNLAAGMTGRTLNGVGGLVLTTLCLTGAVIWWPGLRNLRRGLTVRLRSNWKLLNWDLHQAIGFWTFAIVFMWAVTGVYLVFPRPFQFVIDHLQTSEVVVGTVRPGDVVLEWFTTLHFGRFAGLGTRILWATLGLVPPLLFVTGVIMWWNRVGRRLGKGDQRRQLSISSNHA